MPTITVIASSHRPFRSIPLDETMGRQKTSRRSFGRFSEDLKYFENKFQPVFASVAKQSSGAAGAAHGFSDGRRRDWAASLRSR
jgi:hypothetical protein